MNISNLFQINPDIKTLLITRLAEPGLASKVLDDKTLATKIFEIARTEPNFKKELNGEIDAHIAVLRLAKSGTFKTSSTKRPSNKLPKGDLISSKKRKIKTTTVKTSASATKTAIPSLIKSFLDKRTSIGALYSDLKIHLEKNKIDTDRLSRALNALKTQGKIRAQDESIDKRPRFRYFISA